MTLKGNEFTSTWHDPQDIMALWAKFGHTSHMLVVGNTLGFEIKCNYPLRCSSYNPNIHESTNTSPSSSSFSLHPPSSDFILKDTVAAGQSLPFPSVFT